MQDVLQNAHKMSYILSYKAVWTSGLKRTPSFIQKCISEDKWMDFNIILEVQMRYKVIYSHVSQERFFVLSSIVYNEVPTLFTDILEFRNVINREAQVCLSNFSLYESEGI